VNYRKLLEDIPVGIFILEQKSKEVLFFNKTIARLARPFREESKSSLNSSEEQFVDELDIMNTIDNFTETKGVGTLGNVVRNWRSERLEDQHKYEYNKNGYKLICSIKGLRLSLQSQESEVFLLEDQTAFEDLIKLENKYQKLYVASIVHDIRSPLNGIIGMIEKIDTLTNDPKIRNCIDITRKACQLLLFLTYDITDFSQLEANKFKENPKRVQIREILHEVAELLSFSFETKGLTCNIIANEAVPIHILIDRHRYMQILLNLATNALKFTFQGSITIEVFYDRFSNQLITSVVDTGIGIKPEDIPNLFELFGKLESSSELNPQGVGFGLAMCKKLCERLGGSIGVQSIPNKGSTFTFSVNASSACRRVAGLSTKSIEERVSSSTGLSLKIEEHTFRLNKFGLATKRESTISPNKTLLEREDLLACSATLVQDKCECNKILIVDDDPCNLFVIQSYIQQVGLLADEALNGKDAIDLIMKKSQDRCCSSYKMLFMDLNMPIMSGIEATKILREKIMQKEISEMIIVALSARALDLDEDVYFCKTNEFDFYLTKPVSKKDLIRLLTQYSIS